ncbi:hypothetical protein GCM10023321_71180 [Pseudonocardia eucalypti]|uniref:Uncharacterized protein n=1 Tax=Pseudonocardia eucalypti TaxID=648755 RepID=A0ABP9R5V0_9PSEU|nr:hypothetical protein [Pseudonocardia eucalypti]
MRLEFLGKESRVGESPTLYATDRGTYVIQGWKVTDPAARATMALPDHEDAVEIPAGLVRFFPEEHRR